MDPISTSSPKPFLDATGSEWKMTREDDALDLIAQCGEQGVERVLFGGTNLTDDFYNLHTGLAGILLQKLVVYHVKAAAVLPAERMHQGRFGEMIVETNRGRQFRAFTNREDAITWLQKD